MSADVLDTIDRRKLGQELQHARKRHGLTQEQAAAEIGVSRPTMVAIEKGERRIKAGELIKLARAYGRTVNDFVRQRPELEPFEVQFRGPFVRSQQDEQEIAPVIDQFEELCRNYLELEQITDSPLVRKYPPEYKVAGLPLERTAESIALEERNRLGLGDGPSPILRDILEQDIGLRIFYLAMPAKFSEIYFYTDRLGGCIAVNSTHPQERCRWSLSHGYFHFLESRREPHYSITSDNRRLPESERLADAFTRYFLMPTAGLTRRFNDIERNGSVTIADLCTLANFYGVSVEALTRRLEAMRLLPSGMWDRLRGNIRIRDIQTQLGLKSLSTGNQKLPMRYQYLAIEAFRKGLLSEGQLARFLDVDRLEARQAFLALRQSNDDLSSGDSTAGDVQRALDA